MSTEPSPLKYMGTQSQETVNMAAAMARAVESKEKRARQTVGRMSEEVDEESGKLGAVADWAMSKAREALRSAAGKARERASAKVATYTRDDPLRAMLIAAGVGALLMALLAGTTRSGVRAARRGLRR